MGEKTIGECFRRKNFLRAIELLDGLEYLLPHEAALINRHTEDLLDAHMENVRYEKECDRMGENREYQGERIK